ncbi:MAG: UbiX family flavin prenyltransferase [Actinobacteria bacterium]|nr:UbiX family flavin prenyltransferase [Actinomycetota bacterium]
MKKYDKKIIVAVTGASGVVLAIELIDVMRKNGVELHGIVSDAAEKVLKLELDLKPEAVQFDKLYSYDDFAAAPSSGSSRFDGMVIIPCSMGTLAAVANGVSSNLIHRAADVTLKEKRPLVLVPRETPMNRVHLENMLKAHDAGAVIMPPVPAFYHRPETIKDITCAFAARVAHQFGIEVDGYNAWG